MSYRNNRFTFTEANIDDADGILEILEENPFPGGVSLIYTRRPNPYLSYASEGDETVLAVCRDLDNGQIAGLGVCSIRELYVNGKVEKVGYLEGLRVRAEYRTQIIRIPEGYNYIFEQCRKRDVSYYITTILEENLIAQKFLEKRRRNMPDYNYVGNYEVLTFMGRKTAKLPGGYEFRAATSSDIPNMVKLLNDYGCKYQFHPVINEELFNKYPGLSVDNFQVLLLNNEIVACGAIWNQQSFKQYVVKSYAGVFKLLYNVSRLFRLAVLPPVGGYLPINMLAFCGVRDFDSGCFDLFLRKVLAVVPRNQLLSVGFSTSNPFLKTAKGIKHILYKSKIYIVDPDKRGEDVQLVEGPIHIECATL